MKRRPTTRCEDCGALILIGTTMGVRPVCDRCVGLHGDRSLLLDRMGVPLPLRGIW